MNKTISEAELKCIHCGKNVSNEDNFKYGIFDEPMHKNCVTQYNAKLERERDKMGCAEEYEEQRGVMNDNYIDYHQKAKSKEEFLFYKENGWC